MGQILVHIIVEPPKNMLSPATALSAKFTWPVSFVAGQIIDIGVNKATIEVVRVTHMMGYSTFKGLELICKPYPNSPEFSAAEHFQALAQHWEKAFPNAVNS